MCINNQKRLPGPQSTEEAIEILTLIIASNYFYAYNEAFKPNVGEDAYELIMNLAKEHKDEFEETAQQLYKIARWESMPPADCCEKFQKGECNEQQRRECAIRVAMPIVQEGKCPKCERMLVYEKQQPNRRR